MLTEFRFRTAVPTRVLIPPPKRRMKRRMKRRRMKRATRRCIRGRTNRPLLVGHRPAQRTDSGTTRHAGINRCRTRSFGLPSRLMAHCRYNTVVPASPLLEGVRKGTCLRRTARGAPAASGAGYWCNGGASLRSAKEGAKGRHDGGSPGAVTTSLKLASSAIESHARGACAAAGGRRGGDLEGKFQNLGRTNPSIGHRCPIGAVKR